MSLPSNRKCCPTYFLSVFHESFLLSKSPFAMGKRNQCWRKPCFGHVNQHFNKNLPNMLVFIRNLAQGHR
jgi:hypothetical protein